MKIYKSFSLPDILVMGVGLLISALVLSGGMRGKWILTGITVAIFFVLMIPLGEKRVYGKFGVIARFLIKPKKYGVAGKGVRDIGEIISHERVTDDLVENKDGTLALVLEVEPINLFLMDEYQIRMYTDRIFGSIVKSLGQSTEMLVMKLEEINSLGEQIKEEDKRLKRIIDGEAGVFSGRQVEVVTEIIKDRKEVLRLAGESGRIVTNRYYIAFIGDSEESLKDIRKFAEERFTEKNIKTQRLFGENLKQVISSYGDFVEAEFTAKGMRVGEEVYSFRQITGFPEEGESGWLYDIFSLPGTRAYMRIAPVSKEEARKNIDRSILEIKEKAYSGKASEQAASDIHEEGLRELLYEIEDGKECVAQLDIVICTQEKEYVSKREVGRKVYQAGFKSEEMYFRQGEGYIQTLLRKRAQGNSGNNLPGSVIGNAYPFISDKLRDKEGILVGENSEPVFLNIFKRDAERINSNMIIVGRSGSGKSYAAKTILTGLISEGVKVCILDPEGEYGKMVKNLGGRVLKASSGRDSRINPFEILASVQDEDSTFGDFYSHLQFLEEFYRHIFTGAPKEQLDRLGRITAEMYKSKGITDKSVLSCLKQEDYPSFDDLSNYTARKIKESTDPSEKGRLSDIYNLLSKVRMGGSLYGLWNGKTTFDPSENILAYDFQSLISGKNSAVSNAQMLLILKTLENEIIRNRAGDGKKRKICVVIDEAHVFIDEKYPAALDFMYSLAKRIRKYEGMLMVITQNIKDFAGSPETAKKTSAIINASQYSLIFSLNPGDMADLVALYSKAGEITLAEREGIENAPRGRALLISSPNRHTFLDIIATKKTYEKWEG